MRRLESIVHPLVEEERLAFLQHAAMHYNGHLVVLDIPLLYESKAEHTVSAGVICRELQAFMLHACLCL
jgi:dephospho-CoA kinase